MFLARHIDAVSLFSTSGPSSLKLAGIHPHEHTKNKKKKIVRETRGEKTMASDTLYTQHEEDREREKKKRRRRPRIVPAGRQSSRITRKGEGGIFSFSFSLGSFARPRSFSYTVQSIHQLHTLCCVLKNLYSSLFNLLKGSCCIACCLIVSSSGDGGRSSRLEPNRKLHHEVPKNKK